jgi:predicted  nucleic acid-binding Zn-ribbon protein
MSDFKLETQIQKLKTRIQILEEENVGTTNELYELMIDMDFIKMRLQTLEDFIVGDNK